MDDRNELEETITELFHSFRLIRLAPRFAWIQSCPQGRKKHREASPE